LFPAQKWKPAATSPDVFYSANLAGESEYDVVTGYFIVNAYDSSQTHLHEGETATVANLYDHNRDGSVTADDTQIAWDNVNARLIQLVAP